MFYVDPMEKQSVSGRSRAKAGKFVRFGGPVLAELRKHAARESRSIQGQIVYYVLQCLARDREKLKAAS